MACALLKASKQLLETPQWPVPIYPSIDPARDEAVRGAVGCNQGLAQLPMLARLLLRFLKHLSMNHR